MKISERIQSVRRTPKLLWNTLARGQYDFVFDLMPLSARRMSLSKRLNLLWSGGNLVYRRSKPWSMPLHMQIELTNYCMLHCPICPTGIRAIKRRPEAMDVCLFERLMEQVGPYLLTASLWGWGEPLLHPQLAEILRIAQKYPTARLLSTNGQMLEHAVDALITYPPEYLIVALDGITDETLSRYRRGAKLAPALSGVRRLAQIKRERGLELPVLHMRYIVMQHNQHELPQVSEFARSNGFDLLTIRVLMSVVDADAPTQEHQRLVPDLEGLRAYAYTEGERVKRRDFICMQPFWFPAICADGTIVGCDQDHNSQLPFGILSERTSFAEIWNGAQAARIRQAIRDKPETMEFCRVCPFADCLPVAGSVQSFWLNDKMRYPIVVFG
jgi:MoaA/NifB/PqqE/SkfB family radical SAM enzyme